jgi:indole-3-glycerol phosphate synthase
MNILDRIVENKKKELVEKKRSVSIDMLAMSNFYRRKTISLSESICVDNASGIIAEFKRSSPSKGIINNAVSPLQVAKDYQAAGASAISILTDVDFFGGSDDDILSVRDSIDIPILRKEFIIDPFQIHEARSLGADIILLIAACLSPDEVRAFSALARSLSLEVLLELHDEDEIGHICDEVNFVGINNRSLKTFDVNIQRSLDMAKKIPSDKLKIAESGIDNPATISLFKENGYAGFLIGENFMKTSDPGAALSNFIKRI